MCSSVLPKQVCEFHKRFRRVTTGLRHLDPGLHMPTLKKLSAGAHSAASPPCSTGSPRRFGSKSCLAAYEAQNSKALQRAQIESDLLAESHTLLLVLFLTPPWKLQSSEKHIHRTTQQNRNFLTVEAFKFLRQLKSEFEDTGDYNPGPLPSHTPSTRIY